MGPAVVRQAAHSARARRGEHAARRGALPRAARARPRPCHRTAARSLYISGGDAAAQEALCGALLARPPEALAPYLLQLVYLAVSRPAGPLERAVAALCGRCFNIALQVR